MPSLCELKGEQVAPQRFDLLGAGILDAPVHQVIQIATANLRGPRNLTAVLGL